MGPAAASTVGTEGRRECGDRCEGRVRGADGTGEVLLPLPSAPLEQVFHLPGNSAQSEAPTETTPSPDSGCPGAGLGAGEAICVKAKVRYGLNWWRRGMGVGATQGPRPSSLWSAHLQQESGVAKLWPGPVATLSDSTSLSAWRSSPYGSAGWRPVPPTSSSRCAWLSRTLGAPMWKPGVPALLFSNPTHMPLS